MTDKPAQFVSSIRVLKRDGREEEVSLEKLTSRIAASCDGLDLEFVSPATVAKGVIGGLYNGVTTVALEQLVAETAGYMCLEHPDYSKLAARISMSSLRKSTPDLFSASIKRLYEYSDPATGMKAGLISDTLYATVQKHGAEIDARIDNMRDENYNYFGFKTLEKSYLLRLDGEVAERPQYMLMRVALGIHGNDLEAAFETYDLMSNKWFTHASPTLFNAGTKRPQMSSCYLLDMEEDSIEGIYDTVKKCARVSKAAGGIGLSVGSIRARGTYIKGTKGISNGLVPMLRVFDATARYVDQGGGKRPGAFAVYVEPWHSDIFDVLDLRKNLRWSIAV